MKIRNDIAYTTTGNDGTRYENRVAIDRPRCLTPAGAQRILRESHPTAVVSQVSCIAYS